MQMAANAVTDQILDDRETVALRRLPDHAL